MFVEGGISLFGQKFQEGKIGVSIEFDSVDDRSIAAIVLQYDPNTKDIITFEICGGGVPAGPGKSGYLFRLRSFTTVSSQFGQQRNSADQSKVWTSLFEVGFGKNLRPKQSYSLEVSVSGSVCRFYVDTVEVGAYTLGLPALLGFPCGLLALSESNVHFSNVYVEPVLPKAFIVMQFQTEVYEQLFKEVVEPVCMTFGLQPYRADFTYMPGLIIEDIKKQIKESRIIIAEITPENPNVYFEVGFADALGKDIILISDRKEGMKPFDVRAYRTIFYDNSIAGKRKIEDDLRSYLHNIIGGSV